MAAEDFEVPPEWLPLSAHLDSMADALRALMTPEPPWTVDSPAAAIMASEDSYVALPYRRPGNTALVTPLLSVGHMQDHLSALAACIRTKHVMVATMTLLRTYLVAAGEAYYLMDTSVDAHERMRRVVNADLLSLTEAMKMYRGTDIGRYDVSVTERKEIVSAARALGWQTTTQEPRKNSTRIFVWHVGDEPPTEMHRVRRLLSDVMPFAQADWIYRALSASTHAQPFGLTSLMDRSTLEPTASGGYRGAVSMDGKSLLVWSTIVAFAAHQVVTRGSQLYGWDLLRWRTVGQAPAQDWLEQLKQSSPLSRLWLPV